MGNAEQAPLGFYFLQPSQEEPSEAPILLDASENGLDIRGALFSQSGSLLRQEQILCTRAHRSQAKTDLDLAIALSLGTLFLEGALAAILALVHPAFALEAIVRTVVMRGCVAERLPVGTSKGILGFIIGHVFGREGVGFTAWSGLLVKGVVFDERLNAFLFKVGVVFLTAIGTVGNGVLGLLSAALPFRFFHVRDHATRVAGPLMHAEPHHKLLLGTRLDIVARLQLPVFHVIFFHPHEGRIVIRFSIAVAAS